MDGDFLAAQPSVFEDGGTGDVTGLGKDVELAEPVHCGVGRKGGEFVAVAAVERADAGEPVVDHAMAEIFDRRADAAATVVAANDDVADFEDVHGVLDHGEDVEIGLGDDVGDVAVDEDLTGREAGDLVGGHPAVRATDPEVFGVLLFGELAEKRGIAGADFFRPVAVVFQEVAESFHDGVGENWLVTRHRGDRPPRGRVERTSGEVARLPWLWRGLSR